ncbi:hypothetical protein HPP92_025290 [Vanilla planifolia]|uniref:Uncharacterized protein n=1 Tax=Vanilla planifolia TaxID=51239 RepID=A0A835PI64_VANPL|nr:hypothetical protein HPP92_025290 [Vanilla planifolia]
MRFHKLGKTDTTWSSLIPNYDPEDRRESSFENNIKQKTKVCWPNNIELMN